MHACMQMNTHTRIYGGWHTYAGRYQQRVVPRFSIIHTGIHTYIHTVIHTNTQAGRHEYINIHRQAYIHTYIHTRRQHRDIQAGSDAVIITCIHILTHTHSDWHTGPAIHIQRAPSINTLGAHNQHIDTE